MTGKPDTSENQTKPASGRLNRRWLAAAALLAVLVSAGLLPQTRNWWSGPRSSSLSPAGAAVWQVSPGPSSVVPGTPLRINASAQPAPNRATLRLLLKNGRRQEIPANLTGTNSFTWQLPPVQETFSYQVLSPLGASPEYAVTLDSTPRVGKIELQAFPPADSSLPPHPLDPQAGEVLPGSRVRLLAHLQGPAPARVQLMKGATIVGSLLLQGLEASTELQVTESGQFGLLLESKSGQSILLTNQFSLLLRQDHSPLVDFAGPALQTGQVAREEELSFQLVARDDLSLARITLLIQPEHGPLRRRDLTPAKPLSPREWTLPVRVAIADLGLEPGDVFSLQAEALDGAGQLQTNAPVSLTVGTPVSAHHARICARLGGHLARMRQQQENLLRQAATWEAARKTFQPEEITGLMADLGLLDSQLAETWQTVGSVGLQMQEMALSETHFAAAHWQSSGQRLQEWARAQASIFEQHYRSVEKAPVAKVPELLDMGLLLNESAQEELDRLCQQMVLLRQVMETEALATLHEAVQGRYRHQFAALCGARGWNPAEGLRNGLHATFFEGTLLSGTVLQEMNSLPEISDYRLPKYGRTNWSAVFQGDIYIPESGTWLFRCQANDGVRVTIRGKSLFNEAQAWKSQATVRDFSGTLPLPAGWHPIRIDYFQGEGGSRLRLFCGRENAQTLYPVPVSYWRNRGDIAANQALIRSMVNLPPLPIGQEEARLVATLSSLARAPRQMARLGEEAGVQGLQRLANERDRFAYDLTNRFSRPLTQWDIPALLQAESEADRLAETSLEARRLLEKEFRALEARNRPPTRLAPAYLVMDRLREIMDGLRRTTASQLSRADKSRKEQLLLLSGQAWVGYLRRALAQQEELWMGTAEDAQKSAPERAAALLAVERLRRETSPLELAEVLDPALAEPWKRNERIERLLESLRSALKECSRAEELSRVQHSAALARLAIWQNRRLEVVRAGNQYDLAGAAQHQLFLTLDQLLRAEQEKGNFKAADWINPLRQNGRDLPLKLKPLAVAFIPELEGLAELALLRLTTALEELKAGDSRSLSAHLRVARQALLLEFGRALDKQQPQLSQALGGLAGALATGAPADAEKLTALGQELKNVLGIEGEAMRSNALGAFPENLDLSSGENLARLAATAVTDKTKRAELLQALARQAGTNLLVNLSSPELLQQKSQELSQSTSDLAVWQAREKIVRNDFLLLQARIARDFKQLQLDATQAALKATNSEVGAALQLVSLEPGQALVQTLENLSSTPALSLDQLLSQAHFAGLQLQEQLSMPLASYFRKAAISGQEDGLIAETSPIGLALARLTANQFEAVNRLDRYLSHLESLQKRLLQQTVEATTLLAPDDQPVTPPQNRLLQIQQRAEIQQAEANRQQLPANQDMARAAESGGAAAWMSAAGSLEKAVQSQRVALELHQVIQANHLASSIPPLPLVAHSWETFQQALENSRLAELHAMNALNQSLPPVLAASNLQAAQANAARAETGRNKASQLLQDQSQALSARLLARAAQAPERRLLQELPLPLQAATLLRLLPQEPVTYQLANQLLQEAARRQRLMQQR